MRHLAVLLLSLALVAPTALAQAIIPVIVYSGGKPVMSLVLPQGGTTTVSGEKTVIVVPAQKVYFDIRPVPGAKTVDDAVPTVGDLLKDEMTNFKTVGANDVDVGGRIAKDVTASGVEADDGDPSVAEIILFSLGGNVYAASAHGEDPVSADQRKAMLEILQSARPMSTP